MEAQVMEAILFYLFAATALTCGVLVVANPLSRNPVTSAMFLVLTMLSLAGLFVLLQAYFLAAVQILVYAGAVMVLFLFVIMLLDLKEEEQRRTGWVRGALGVISVGLFAIFLVRTLAGVPSTPSGQAGAAVEAGAKGLGRLLFTDYLLPFEVMSILLLVGMVGVVILSKKELK